jgi:hypothetical protein
MMWLRLKLDMIPCISQEVTRALELYNLLEIEARGGDRQKMKELAMFQASIRGRIEEFEQFYEENALDDRIGYFEKQKLRLRKLLHPKAPPKPRAALPSAPSPQPDSISTELLVKTALRKQQESRETTPLPSKDSEWKEVVFRIKLTPEEFSRLRIAKAQRASLL